MTAEGRFVLNMSENRRKTKTVTAPAKHVMTQEENDLMMNRLMLGFVIAVCAVTLVMTLKNSFNTIQIYETVGPVMTVVCLILAVLAGVFFGLRTKRGTDDSRRVLTRWNVLVCGLIALFCAAVFFVNPSVACAYSVAMVIGACVLYFIWYIYPRVFFAASCMALIEGFLIHAGFGLSTTRAFSSIIGLACRIGAAVLPVIAAILFVLAAKKHPRAFAGFALWQTLVICAAALVGALALWCGALGIFYIAYHYVLYAIAAVLAVFGIVYTVRSI